MEDPAGALRKAPAPPWDGAVLERVRRDLERAVARICPPRMAAQREDLVQMALVRVLDLERRRGERRELSPSYLKKVAYSVLVDEIRRRRVRPEVPLETEEKGQGPRPVPDPERHSWGRQIGRSVRVCLSRLARGRRQAVTLYLLGYKVPQVAERMTWPRKRAENLVYRGLEDLRRCLAVRGITP